MSTRRWTVSIDVTVDNIAADDDNAWAAVREGFWHAMESNGVQGVDLTVWSIMEAQT